MSFYKKKAFLDKISMIRRGSEAIENAENDGKIPFFEQVENN